MTTQFPPVYMDLSMLKHRLNVTTDQWDDDLSEAIEEASRAVDEICDRQFYPDAVTDPPASSSRTFIPDNPGWCAIDELSVLTSITANDDETPWVIDQDFYLEPMNAAAKGEPWTAIRTIARPFLFTASDVGVGWVGIDQRVTVTGQFGWAATPVQIRRATSIIAAKMFQRKDATYGVLGVGADNTAIRIGSYDPDVQTLLQPFIRTALP